MSKKETTSTFVEPEIIERMEQERGRETLSAYHRRILVRWHNELPGTDGEDMIVE